MLRFESSAFLALLATVLFAAVQEVSSITRGEMDDTGLYPSNGALMVDFIELDQPEYGYGVWCSGVLIHEKVFLTAAHCLYNNEFLDEDGYPLDRPLGIEPGAPDRSITGAGMWVSFNNEPTDFFPKVNQKKCKTCLDIERAIVSPDYKANGRPESDVAVVILRDSVGRRLTPMQLPTFGYLDDLKQQQKLNNAPIINVGYGASFDLTTKKKHDTEYLDTRMYSNSTVKNLNQDFLGLNMQSNSGNGGVCYGDSGGAGYYEDDDGKVVIVGLVSWGDANCVSTHRKVRIDVGDNYLFVQCIMNSADTGEFDSCLM